MDSHSRSRDGKNPPSLRKILNELDSDPRVSPPASGNLESWTNQDVLLLNTVLTVIPLAPRRIDAWAGNR